MGSAALKAMGAATVGGAHSIMRNCDRQMKDGEQLTVGGVIITCLATPGHTPESVCYTVAQASHPERAWCVFTGDTLLLGDAGRPDLTAEDAGECAGQMWDAAHAKLAPLGESVLVFPAHTSGSACGGGALATLDQSTIGYEKIHNLVFTMSRDDFVRRKQEEHLPLPPHFAQMEKLNLRGGSAMPQCSAAPLSPEAFAKEAQAGVIIDTRSAESFASGHVPHSYSIWLEGLPLYASWIVPENRLVYLVVERREDAAAAVLHLARIGCDTVSGVLAGGFEAWRDAGMPVQTSAVISAKELAEANLPLLDVRTESEYREGHVEGATHIFCGDVIAQLNRLPPREQPLAVTCSVGNRGSMAASILRIKGYTDVRNLVGGMHAWTRARLPVERSSEPAEKTKQQPKQAEKSQPKQSTETAKAPAKQTTTTENAPVNPKAKPEVGKPAKQQQAAPQPKAVPLVGPSAVSPPPAMADEVATRK
jgi:hydroxyacylglutathione hydrolase